LHACSIVFFHHTDYRPFQPVEEAAQEMQRKMDAYIASEKSKEETIRKALQV